MAFSEPVGPGGTPWRIPLVQDSHSPGHKKMFEKTYSMTFRFLSTRSGVEVRDGHERSHFQVLDYWDGFSGFCCPWNYFHQKCSVCFLSALTFAASHTKFYQKILITTKVSFDKHVFHESRNQGKSGTWFRFWSLTTTSKFSSRLFMCVERR